MNFDNFQVRTKAYGIRVLALIDTLPQSFSYRRIYDQLMRSSLSVGANYRAACRAKSKPDFISKMGTVEEECDESLYWMEILVEAGIAQSEQLEDIVKEGRELLAMVVASIITARNRR